MESALQNPFSCSFWTLLRACLFKSLEANLMGETFHQRISKKQKTKHSPFIYHKNDETLRLLLDLRERYFYLGIIQCIGLSVILSNRIVQTSHFTHKQLPGLVILLPIANPVLAPDKCQA